MAPRESCLDICTAPPERRQTFRTKSQSDVSRFVWKEFATRAQTFRTNRLTSHTYAPRFITPIAWIGETFWTPARITLVG
jgi:hypothetical protein